MKDIQVKKYQVVNQYTLKPHIESIEISEEDEKKTKIEGRPYIITIELANTYTGDKVIEHNIIVISNSPGEAIMTFFSSDIGIGPKWQIKSVKARLPIILADMSKRIRF